jgi:rod shape-determining protein MreB
MNNSVLIAKLQRAVSSTWQGFRPLLTGELAIDLGTANTRIFAPGRGVVLNEPSVIALNARNDQVVAVGRAAKRLIGRESSSIRVVRPLRDGVIADFEAAEKMLSTFMRRALAQWIILSPQVLICIPGEITEVERRAVEDAAYHAGARQVEFIEEPFAAAAGVGIETEAAHASAVIDIGAGTVDIAVLSLGGLIHASTLRTGGMAMDHALAHYLREEHSLEVGEETAEMIKRTLGSVEPHQSNRAIEVGGRSLLTRLPARIKVTSAEVQTAMAPVVAGVMRAVIGSLEKLPPEVSADLLDSGIVLTGGGAQLPGLPERLSQETGLEVRLSTNPSLAVVTGAARLLWPEAAAPELRLVPEPSTSSTMAEPDWAETAPSVEKIA